MIVSISVCLAALIWLLSVLRGSRLSFGLPLAYLISLLLIHVPGAFAHVVSQNFLPGPEETEKGIFLTAIGAVCFVVGVILSNVGRVRFTGQRDGVSGIQPILPSGRLVFRIRLEPLFGSNTYTRRYGGERRRGLDDWGAARAARRSKKAKPRNGCAMDRGPSGLSGAHAFVGRALLATGFKPSLSWAQELLSLRRAIGAFWLEVRRSRFSV